MICAAGSAYDRTVSQNKASEERIVYIEAIAADSSGREITLCTFD